MTKEFTGTIVTPGRFAKWILPLGLLGLVPFYVVSLVASAETARAFVLYGRFGFVLAYGALLIFAMKPQRRQLRMVASAGGLHDASSGAVIAAAAEMQDVLHVPAAQNALQVRGTNSFTLEVATAEEALEILRVLHRTNDETTHRFLAKTTPYIYMILSWMGLPVLATFFVQFVLMAHPVAVADRSDGFGGFRNYLPLLAAFIIFWLFCTYWFARRRELLLSPTTFTYPRLLGGSDTYTYSDVEYIRATAAATLELKIRGQRAKSFMLFDGNELTAYLAQMQSRTPPELPLQQSRPRPPVDVQLASAAASSARTGSRTTAIVMIVIGSFLTIVMGWYVAHRFLLIQRAVATDGVIVDSQRRSEKGGGHHYVAEVRFRDAQGVDHEVVSGETRSEPFQNGAHVRVLYDPQNPRESLVDDFMSRWGPVFLGLIGPVALLFAFFELRKSRRPASS